MKKILYIILIQKSIDTNIFFIIIIIIMTAYRYIYRQSQVLVYIMINNIRIGRALCPLLFVVDNFINEMRVMYENKTPLH